MDMYFRVCTGQETFEVTAKSAKLEDNIWNLTGVIMKRDNFKDVKFQWAKIHKGDVVLCGELVKPTLSTDSAPVMWKLPYKFDDEWIGL